MFEPIVSQLAFIFVAGCRVNFDSMTTDATYSIFDPPLFPEWLKTIRDAVSATANRECFDDDEDKTLYLAIISRILAGLTVENIAGG